MVSHSLKADLETVHIQSSNKRSQSNLNICFEKPQNSIASCTTSILSLLFTLKAVSGKNK